MAAFLQKFLPKNKRKVDKEKTIPVPEKPPVEKPLVEPPEEASPGLGLPQLVVASGHSVGQQRDHNEDALYALSSVLVSDTRQIPFGLFIIADGMGGHQHGEVASATAIRAMAGHILSKFYLRLLEPAASSMDQPLQEVMREGVLEAHSAIIKQALGGGTTLTSALILGDQMTIAHVGDSRAYTIGKDGSCEVLTRDHSLVKRLVEMGQLTDEEASIHPQRNVLYRALGQGEPFEPDVFTLPTPPAGYLLICSDGLWGVVQQDEIARIITTAITPYAACEKLVEAANAAGGPDNISSVLVRLPG